MNVFNTETKCSIIIQNVVNCKYRTVNSTCSLVACDKYHLALEMVYFLTDKHSISSTDYDFFSGIRKICKTKIQQDYKSYIKTIEASIFHKVESF